MSLEPKPDFVKAGLLNSAIMSIPVTVELPSNLLPLFKGIAKSFNATDDNVVTDCVRFALFCYQ